MKRVLAILYGLLAAASLQAHPLGNTTVNRQAEIVLDPAAISLRYRVDLAEIPTLLAAAEADADTDGSPSAGEWRRHVQRYAEAIRAGVEIRVDGAPVALQVQRVRWSLLPGAAGLNTLRIDARLAAALPQDRASHRTAMRIDYRDQRLADEAGWKEVVLRARDGIGIEASDVPQASSSRDLRDYPEGEMRDVLAASARAVRVPGVRRDGGAAASEQAARARAVPVAVAKTLPQAAARMAATLRAPAAPAAHTVPRTQLADAAAFFRLGNHHIATGWDHLLFLFGLIVAQPSLRRLAWVVTAFTVAHSLTLGLAAGGLVSPPHGWVEPAIALTIAYVGLSNLFQTQRHGVAPAFAFGLVHGFGFAGALAASMGTLRADSAWLWNLAAFNLGIEAFQLSLVLLLLPLLRAGTRHAWFPLARNAASLAVLGAGVGWFVARV